MSLISLKLKNVATRKFKITYLVCTLFLLNSAGPAKVKQRAHSGWSALERGPARKGLLCPPHRPHYEVHLGLGASAELI